MGQYTLKGHVSREYEVLRTQYTDGTFRDRHCWTSLYIKEAIERSKEVKIEGKPLDLNIDIVKPNNDYVYDHVVVETGVKILDLPSYIQNKDYGIYNGNIGTYIQRYKDKLTIFVYPLFDKDRFNKEPNVWWYSEQILLSIVC